MSSLALQLRESGRLQAYMEERTESLARRYEVEGLKAAMDELAGTLRSEMAAAAEKLKFGLLRDERSEVCLG